MPAERSGQQKKIIELKALVLPVVGLFFGLLLGYLIISGNSLGTGQLGSGTPEIGQSISGFELTSLNGESVRLSQYQGQAVMINFWGTWCPPCVQEMPLLETVYLRKQPNLVILGINQQDSRTNVQQFVADYDISFPILLDEDSLVAEQYLVRGFPTTFFIDADGVLRAQHIGGMDEELLSSYLREIGID